MHVYMSMYCIYGLMRFIFANDYDDDIYMLKNCVVCRYSECLSVNRVIAQGLFPD